MTLYRTYRPQTFGQIVGQKPIKLAIQNQILQDRVAHAYLFTGPRGVGKTTTARILAKSLNCTKRKKDQFEPCNQCQSCLEITKGTSLDLEEKDAASNRGIDEIRNLKEKTRFAPSKSEYKIFIIDEVHMLTIPAFNALLKTLEEPPAKTVFILATTEPFKLPDTVISRCQRFDFKPIVKTQIVNFLATIIRKEGVQVEKSILENIALRSDGCLRDALSMLGQIMALGISKTDKKITWQEAELVIPRSDRKLIQSLVEFLESGKIKLSIELINQLVEQGVDLEQFSLDLIDYLRERMLRKIANHSDQSRFYSKLIDIFLKRYQELKNASVLPQLLLELAVLDTIDLSSNDNSVSSFHPKKN